MPDDPLLPTDPPTPAPSGPTPNKKITCEFCGCTLAPNGDYIALSDKAKTLRQQSETIDKLKATIAERDAAVTSAERERDEARSLVKKEDRLFTW